VQHRWRDQPAVYGPVFLAQARLVDRVAGAWPWAAVWLHKVLAGALFLVCVWLASRLRAEQAGAAMLVAFAWNPLLLFETGGAAHNDVAMLALLLGALVCWRAGRAVAALALVAVAFWYKWYAVLFLPAFAVEFWKRADTAGAVRAAVAFAVATLVCGAVALAPLPGSGSAILRQLLTPAVVQGIFPHETSPLLAALFWPMHALGAFELPGGERAFHTLRTALFALCAGVVLVRQARAPIGVESLAQSWFLLAAGFFSFMVTMLFPWHLLTVVGLGLVCERRPFVIAAAAISVLALLSYFLTFAVGALLLAAVAAALWILRRAR
jgi:alpha-1,6-mannosyltransferase